MSDRDEVTWQDMALCRGMETNWFYDDYEANVDVARVIDSVCSVCPVRELCLEEGMRNHEYGVWGGVYLRAGRVDRTRNMHKEEPLD